MSTETFFGNIVDIDNQEIYPGRITIEDEKIINIDETPDEEYENYIMPGFIDAHVHIESSMLDPSEFARLAVVHGTVATVSDPHEIANVMGVEGVQYMLDDIKKVPFKIYFGAPSCVPATDFETSGAKLSPADVKKLLEKKEVKYLSELMNFPGVLNNDPQVMEKISAAKSLDKPIDGHAPGLMGNDAKKYIESGISTDHECTTLDEAIDKISYGMKILIREGSAAKNYEELHKLVEARPDMCMFCSDDKHPDDLTKGHINELVKRSINEKGYDLWKVLQVACINPIEHYNLDVGRLHKGDFADFIIVNNLEEFKVIKTYCNGEQMADRGKTLMDHIPAAYPNVFNAEKHTSYDYRLKAEGEKIRVIEALDGQLLTNELIVDAKIENGYVVADTENDILKLVVLNRYQGGAPQIAFIKGFGLKSGAIASTVAHDSHNIIAVGVKNKDICKAINTLIDNKGGLAISNNEGKEVSSLPLPIAGLLSDADGYVVAEKYREMDRGAKELGSNFSAPFMTLSFMALLVIPSLKLSDKGLFDGTKFEFVDVQI